jgi:hypothetical protein
MVMGSNEEHLKEVLWQTTVALQAAVRALCSLSGGASAEKPAPAIPKEAEEILEEAEEPPDIAARFGEFLRTASGGGAVHPPKRVIPRSHEEEPAITEEDEDGSFSARRVVDIPEEEEQQSLDGENLAVVHMSDEEIAAVQRST